MRSWCVAVSVVFGLALAAPAALAEPPTTHEIIYNRPSGFWTSNRPAVGGAYRYRLLLIGVAVAGLTGWLTWRLVKNTSPRR